MILFISKVTFSGFNNILPTGYFNKSPKRKTYKNKKKKKQHLGTMLLSYLCFLEEGICLLS